MERGWEGALFAEAQIAIAGRESKKEGKILPPPPPHIKSNHIAPVGGEDNLLIPWRALFSSLPLYIPANITVDLPSL